MLLTALQPGFAAAFGEDWETRISPAQESRLIQRALAAGAAPKQSPYFRAGHLLLDDPRHRPGTVV